MDTRLPIGSRGRTGSPMPRRADPKSFTAQALLLRLDARRSALLMAEAKRSGRTQQAVLRALILTLEVSDELLFEV